VVPGKINICYGVDNYVRRKSMRLKRHRKDIHIIRESWASVGLPPVVVDIATRYQHLVSWAEEVIDPMGSPTIMQRREKQVLRDSKE